MAKGILGTKLGMTQLFDDEGRLIPVTVIQAGPCVVVQRKTTPTDGYNAVQLGFGKVKPKHVTRPMRGHFKRAGVEPTRLLREFRDWDGGDLNQGDVVTVGIFANGDKVDVTAKSRGKGFSGTIKRHHYGRGPMTHGSKYHRGVGSMGASSFPSRVFKGKRLPGRMGGKPRTVQGLQVVRVDEERNLLLIKGNVPGARGGTVVIKTAARVRA